MSLKDKKKKFGQGSNIAQIPEIAPQVTAKQIQVDLQAEVKYVSNWTVCSQLSRRGATSREEKEKLRLE